MMPLAEYGKPGEIINVTDDVIDVSRRLFPCLYDYKHFGDMIHLLHCVDHLHTNTEGDFQLTNIPFAFMLFIVLCWQVVCK